MTIGTQLYSVESILNTFCINIFHLFYWRFKILMKTAWHHLFFPFPTEPHPLKKRSDKNTNTVKSNVKFQTKKCIVHVGPLMFSGPARGLGGVRKCDTRANGANKLCKCCSSAVSNRYIIISQTVPQRTQPHRGNTLTLTIQCQL